MIMFVEYPKVFTHKLLGEFHNAEKSISNAEKPIKFLYKQQTEN